MFTKTQQDKEKVLTFLIQVNHFKASCPNTLSGSGLCFQGSISPHRRQARLCLEMLIKKNETIFFTNKTKKKINKIK